MCLFVYFENEYKCVTITSSVIICLMSTLSGLPLYGSSLTVQPRMCQSSSPAKRMLRTLKLTMSAWKAGWIFRSSERVMAIVLLNLTKKINSAEWYGLVHYMINVHLKF